MDQCLLDERGIAAQGYSDEDLISIPVRKVLRFLEVI